MAARIKAGAVWVNTYRAVSFLMLFGGYKASEHRPGERRRGDRRLSPVQERVDQ